MAWLRRRRRADTPAPAAPPAARLEVALLTLATHAQQLDARLSGIEARLAAQEATPPTAAEPAAPSAEELATLRADTARVAGEVSRLGINLYARYDALAARQDELDGRLPPAAPTLVDLDGELDAPLAWRASA